ncbi:hypothetical protein Q9L58_005905 [Maublancomyces gigas]|uniref:Uncharacterized protein n=1 Tax=Discina gigas TaxID=1032678 RepID=A0ABR3GGY5_9PEZI
MVYSLISVKSSTNDIVPAAWGVIKIRLSTAIAGPASTIISSELTHPEGSVAYKPRSNSNYHTLIVREVTINFVTSNFTLHFCPAPTFSRATNLEYTTTLEWFLDQPVNWKRFDPPVKISIIEARSLELYYKHHEQQQLDNRETQSSSRALAASGGPPPAASPPTVDRPQRPPPTGQQQPGSGRDGPPDLSQRRDNGAPPDRAKDGSTLRQNSTSNWSYYNRPTSSTGSASSTVSDTASDGIDPITFARQHIGGSPMWEEMVDRLDDLMGVAAWVRHVRDACECHGSAVAL